MGGYRLAKGPARPDACGPRRSGAACTFVVEPGLHALLRASTTSYLVQCGHASGRLERAEAARLLPALNALCGSGLFFTSKDAVSFCSFVLPELGRKITIDDPDRLLLNQIPLEPVVQFYLDAPHMGAVRAHPEFLYGEDRVTPFAAPTGLLRDARAESVGPRGCSNAYLQPSRPTPALPNMAQTTEDDALLLSCWKRVCLPCWRRARSTSAMHSATCRLRRRRSRWRVSVQGSVLDLEVDTGEFPVERAASSAQVRSTRKSATTACGMADCCGWTTRWKCWTN